MAGIPFAQHVTHFIQSLERAGSTVLDIGSTQNRPAHIRVISSDGTVDLFLFLWTVTPGGGPPGTRPANERRIQRTGADTPFPLQPGSRTIIGGWSEEFGVWAFWDPRRHTGLSAQSPSLQVVSDVLERAYSDGIAAYPRTSAQGTEVVVAVSDGSLQWYVFNSQSLHDSDEDAQYVSELVNAPPEVERNLIDTARNEPQQVRRYELVQTMRAYRETRFRPEVLQAYTFRCAVCGYALKLVDAANIIPVAYPGGNDHITNGIALCRLHHSAYDTGLLGIQSTYRIVVNPNAGARLRAANLGYGLEDFALRLPEQITVPNSIEVRPNPDYLRVGLQARQWPVQLIA